jgi:probable addiction module antidote protein
MPKLSTDYRSGLLEDLKDPVEAANYLNAALRDTEEMFLLALRDVAESRQMAKVAAKTGVSRESLYRMLSPSGNPTYQNFFGIMKAIGFEFGGVRPCSKPKGSRPESKSRLPGTPSGRRKTSTRRRGRRDP